MANRVVIYLNASGANRGVDPAEAILVGGVTRGSASVLLDGSNNVNISGTLINVSGVLDLTSHKIQNVANPTAAQDVATKSYADGGAGGSVILTNGTTAFTGNESMGGHKLTNLGAPTVGSDATTKTYVDNGDATTLSSADAFATAGDSTTLTAAEAYSDAKEVLDVRLDGSRTMTGALDLGTHLIHNVTNPVVAQDAATKNYVDGLVGSNLTFVEQSYTGGAQGVSSGSFIDVPSVLISFVLSTTKTVLFLAGAAAGVGNPFVQGNYVALGISVNGTDYFLAGSDTQGFNTAGGGLLVVSGFTTGISLTPYKVLTLSAGSYTVKLRALGSCVLAGDSTFPTKLTAVYAA